MSNHRPTLESKRGKRIAIGNLIQHARNQPQHKTLKRRHVSDDDDSVSDDKVADLENDQLVVAGYGTSSDDSDDDSGPEDGDDRDLVKGKAQSPSGSDNDEQEDGDKDEEEEEQSDESSLDDDEEMLREELARTRGERTQVATISKKLSWRSTPFKKARSSTTNDGNDFHTSVIDTKRHRDFMAKYIR